MDIEVATGPFRSYLAGRVDRRVGTICTLATEEVSS